MRKVHHGGHRAEMHRGRAVDETRVDRPGSHPGETHDGDGRPGRRPGENPRKRRSRKPPPLHGDESLGVVGRSIASERDGDYGDVQRPSGHVHRRRVAPRRRPGDADADRSDEGSFAVAARRGGRGVHHVRVGQHQRLVGVGRLGRTTAFPFAAAAVDPDDDARRPRRAPVRLQHDDGSADDGVQRVRRVPEGGGGGGGGSGSRRER